MYSNHNDIKEFAVKVTVEGTTGSGIIIKPTDDALCFYVLTAKHTFKKNENQHESDELLSNETIEEKTIITSLFNENFALKFSNFTFFEDDDLAIFYFTEQKAVALVKSLPMLTILDLEDDFSYCRVIGFPQIRENKYYADNLLKKLETFHCDYAKDIGNTKYELTTRTKLYDFSAKAITCISGLSGGGVLVTTKKGKHFLTGIQLGVLSAQSFECLNVRLLVEKINNKLESIFDIKDKNLHIKVDFSYENENNLDLENTNIDFSEILNSLKNERVVDLKERTNNVLSKQLEIIEKETSYIKKKEDATKHANHELADIYLYYAIVCYKEKNKHRATRYFNKAISYNPFYKKYLYEAKDNKKTDKQEINEISEQALLVEDKKLFIKLIEERIKNISENDDLADAHCKLFLISQNEELSKQIEQLKIIFSLYQNKGTYEDFPISVQNIIYLYLKAKAFDDLARYLNIIIHNDNYPEREIAIDYIFYELLNFFNKNNELSSNEKVTQILNNIFTEYKEIECKNSGNFKKLFDDIKDLATIYLSKKDYSSFETICLEKINVFKGQPEEASLYLLLANSFYKNQKYEKARSFYQDILDNIKVNAISTLQLYIRLIRIAQKLNEPVEKIKEEYQKANSFLKKNRNKIKEAQEYQECDAKLEKIRLEITGYTIDDYLATSREVKENIANIQSMIEPLTKQHQAIDERMKTLEQQVQQSIDSTVQNISNSLDKKIETLNTSFEKIEQLIQENAAKPIEPAKSYFQQFIHWLLKWFQKSK